MYITITNNLCSTKLPGLPKEFISKLSVSKV